MADDHPLVREGLQARLEAQEGIEVVGIAACGQELIDKAQTLLPDVIVTDISMPGLSGLEASQILRRIKPELKILMLTMHDNKEYIRRAVACGADGYVLKDAPAEQMITALRQVSAGGSYFGSSVAEALLVEEDERLTQRETDILLLLIDGLSNREIGERLSISARTVETHRANIYRKIGANSLAGLFKYALRHGLVELE
ncbi:DNA-binding response regulator [Alkalilimnicola ehrlichii]|uniref:DNA-binding response regulator n=1 Tax=Alkalilimnicola ehrlichii TaxID=351052 RepID=A0A3E0WIE5_9GAMM|nr:DNA-binding response regulator [Alkalilimnicola ehrlichii]RFA31897.1 DNA-binding response regulator [Alkalilimnicola ehrlichii]